MSARNASRIYYNRFYIFSNNAFEIAESWRIVGLTTIVRLLQRKNSTFLYRQFLLLHSERGWSPESCLPICHPKASCL